MIKKFPNIARLCWIFSQDIIYKQNFYKIISKLFMNYIELLSQISIFSVSASSTIVQFKLI